MKPATLLKTRTNLKIHLLRGTLVTFVIVCLFISIWNLGIHQVAASSLPAGVVHSFPITLTNTQSVVVPAMFQQMITVDSTLYSPYESSNLQNIEFFDSSGVIIPSWLESGNSNSSTNTIYWLKLANGITANSKATIYMGFADPTTNLFNNQSTGEAPQLSPNYGQYDNGSIVFNYYDNFASSLSGWSASTGVIPSVSDCITVNFSQNGYLVGPSENIGTAFDADVILNPAEINIGYINTNETTTTNYLGSTAWASTVIREACNNTYPDQMDQKAEANACGKVSGSIITGTESIKGIFSVVPISPSSSFQYVNYSIGNSTQPIKTNAPVYPCQVGFAFMSGGTAANGIKVQWVRVRTAPPNGVMPGVSLSTNSSSTSTQAVKSLSPGTSSHWWLLLIIILGVLVVIAVVVLLMVRNRKSKKGAAPVAEHGKESEAKSEPAAKTPEAETSGPANRLRQLKTMLEKGLITQQDYDEKKREILEEYTK